MATIELLTWERIGYPTRAATANAAGQRAAHMYNRRLSRGSSPLEQGKWKQNASTPSPTRSPT